MYLLRTQLEQARTLLEMIRKREKLKKEVLVSTAQIFDLQILESAGKLDELASPECETSSVMTSSVSPVPHKRKFDESIHVITVDKSCSEDEIVDIMSIDSAESNLCESGYSRRGIEGSLEISTEISEGEGADLESTEVINLVEEDSRQKCPLEPFKYKRQRKNSLENSLEISSEEKKSD